MPSSLRFYFNLSFCSPLYTGFLSHPRPWWTRYFKRSGRVPIVSLVPCTRSCHKCSLQSLAHGPRSRTFLTSFQGRAYLIPIYIYVWLARKSNGCCLILKYTFVRWYNEVKIKVQVERLSYQPKHFVLPSDSRFTRILRIYREFLDSTIEVYIFRLLARYFDIVAGWVNVRTVFIEIEDTRFMSVLVVLLRFHVSCLSFWPHGMMLLYF